jgi:hypothetical protein
MGFKMGWKWECFTILRRPFVCNDFFFFFFSLFFFFSILILSLCDRWPVANISMDEDTSLWTLTSILACYNRFEGYFFCMRQ